jgi:DNA-binding Lrp family transcriptional regulator
VNWRPTTLTFGQWSSILSLIDPMSSLILAVLLVSEYFPIVFLLITIFILILSIILRYAHEVKNLVRACILITLKKGELKDLPLKILKYYGVISVDYLAGTHDLLLNVKMNNIKEFYHLINLRLRKLNEVENILILFVNKIEQYER